MLDVPPTHPETVRRARRIARAAGLRYVYTGNVHDAAGGTTHCPSCGAACVVRDWYTIIDYQLDASGRCAECGGAVAGRYAERVEGFGRRRIPLRIVP
ncbi:MAG: AmmeMemoRadiSam system radical SAM enzyme, partial [Pelomonas sp.]|nr:AmmeMemoRadiSam system radical SAM enzyme [Roseateles sp.]